MTEDEKTVHIAGAVGLMEIVLYYEKKVNPKSAKCNGLKNLIDNAIRTVNHYRVNEWAFQNAEAADKMYEQIEKIVKRAVYGPKTVGRDPKTGRFTQLQTEE